MLTWFPKAFQEKRIGCLLDACHVPGNDSQLLTQYLNLGEMGFNDSPGFLILVPKNMAGTTQIDVQVQGGTALLRIMDRYNPQIEVKILAQ